MQWFHHFFLTWMQFILDWGYLGIFIMMAFESTALPIPAEIVMPPAAYWASQGHFNLALVIVAAKRARQINDYHHQLGEGIGFEQAPPPLVESRSKNYLTMSLEEISEGKLKYSYSK